MESRKSRLELLTGLLQTMPKNTTRYIRFIIQVGGLKYM